MKEEESERCFENKKEVRKSRYQVGELVNIFRNNRSKYKIIGIENFQKVKQ